MLSVQQSAFTLGLCRFEVDRYGQTCATTLSHFQVCMVKLRILPGDDDDNDSAVSCHFIVNRGPSMHLESDVADLISFIDILSASIQMFVAALNNMLHACCRQYP